MIYRDVVLEIGGARGETKKVGGTGDDWRI